MWILSGDIRDQIRKLSKIVPKFGRFLALPEFRRRAFQKSVITLASRHVVWKKFREDGPEVIGVFFSDLRYVYLFWRYSRSKSDIAKIDRNFACFWPPIFFRGGPPNFWTLSCDSSQIPIMWQSFVTIGRGTSEMWLLKKEKKHHG